MVQLRTKSAMRSPSFAAAAMNCWLRMNSRKSWRTAQNGRAAADQTRTRSNRAGYSPRPYGGAEQNAPAAGAGTYGDLPDRRFHRVDRRSVWAQRWALAAVTRADPRECADVFCTGHADSGPWKNRDSLQQ